MRLEHHLVGGYVRYIHVSPYIIIITICVPNQWAFLRVEILNGFKRSISRRAKWKLHVHHLSDNHINILFEKIYMYTVKPHMYMYMYMYNVHVCTVNVHCTTCTCTHILHVRT